MYTVTKVKFKTLLNQGFYARKGFKRGWFCTFRIWTTGSKKCTLSSIKI